MRLIVIIMTTCLMQVSASTFAQKLTFSKKGASLEQIFKEIEKQTGYNVLYSARQAQNWHTIDADFKNEDLKNVLENLTTKQNLTYTIDDQNISIKAKVCISNKLTPLFRSKLAA